MNLQETLSHLLDAREGLEAPLDLLDVAAAKLCAVDPGIYHPDDVSDLAARVGKLYDALDTLIVRLDNVYDEARQLYREVPV